VKKALALSREQEQVKKALALSREQEQVEKENAERRLLLEKENDMILKKVEKRSKVDEEINTVIKAIILLPTLITTISKLETLDDDSDSNPNASIKDFYQDSDTKYNKHYEAYKNKVINEKQNDSKKYNDIESELVEGNFDTNFNSREDESITDFTTNFPKILKRGKPCNSKQLDKMIEALAILEVITYSNDIIIMEDLRAIVLEYLIHYCPEMQALLKDMQQSQAKKDQEYQDTGAGVGFRKDSQKQKEEVERLHKQKQSADDLITYLLEEIEASSEKEGILSLLKYLNLEIITAKAEAEAEELDVYDINFVNNLHNLLIDEVIKTRSINQHINDLNELSVSAEFRVELVVSDLESQKKDNPIISIDLYMSKVIESLIESFENEKLSLSREEVINRQARIDKLIINTLIIETSIEGLDTKSKAQLQIYSELLQQHHITQLELEKLMKEQIEEQINNLDSTQANEKLINVKDLIAKLSDEYRSKPEIIAFIKALQDHIAELKLREQLTTPQEFNKLMAEIPKLDRKAIEELQRVSIRLEQDVETTDQMTETKENFDKFGRALEERITLLKFKQQFITPQEFDKLMAEIPKLDHTGSQEKLKLIKKLQNDVSTMDEATKAKFEQYGKSLEDHLTEPVFLHRTGFSISPQDTLSKEIPVKEEYNHVRREREYDMMRRSDREYDMMRRSVRSVQEEEPYTNGGKKSQNSKKSQKSRKQRKQIKSRKSRKQKISRKQRRQRKSRKFRKLIKSKTL